MFVRKPFIVLVCLMLLLGLGVTGAGAYTILKAGAMPVSEDLFAPAVAKTKPIFKVKPDKITKCRPPVSAVSPHEYRRLVRPECVLPSPGVKKWNMDVTAVFARMKGKVRFIRGNFFGGFTGFQQDVDMNSDMNIPDHGVGVIMSASYRFRPNWSVRYMFMPMEVNGGGDVPRQFTFGNNSYGTNQNTRAKWERQLHRVGLVYDAKRTATSRLSLYGDYLKLDEKISVFQPGCCGDTLYNDLNMAMAGVEMEKCIRTGGRLRYPLSLTCSAGVAFMDEAFGSDLSSGLKYTIPMGQGRWGYVEGGYRYLTLKKGYSDVKEVDTSIEGGFVKVGFVF